MPIDDPSDPPRSGRIIIPGQEPDEAPLGAQPAPGAPRIVLPPGVARETPDDLPEYPRLRPLMLMPIRDRERELLLVNDPLGVIPGQPVLGIESLALLQLLDGTTSINDLIAVLMRESKDLRVGNLVRDFIAELDRMLMLDSPRFERAYRELREAYHPLEVRPAALEGHGYPAEPAPLAHFVEAHFAEAEQMRVEAGEPAPAQDARPRAVLSPHLDPRRAGPTIARALLEIGAEPRGPLRLVVFGTGHSLFGDLVALTRKHFETPLGKVACDTAFVDAVAARLGDAAYRAELAHRDEHSIEFIAVYLRGRFKERPLRIVPILCGGFHALIAEGKTPREDATFETMVTAVREAEERLGGDTVYVAGVDFSHIGPRFGDPPVDEDTRKEVRALDHEAIDAARRGDADAWFSAIAAHEDSTRICGFGPTYALLRCAAPGTGRLLHYDQSEEPDTSFVSVAAMAWP
ncbi:MAG: AmmeMemoRadiSam system protein B [Candidatus Eisenbacteria bacterium RBG_16_71_46]|nr:MAG: AmmeMemoRadiSam system protein B [Candidatus Eisenbacteria bacterium RBG_16_71_46]